MRAAHPGAPVPPQFRVTTCHREVPFTPAAAGHDPPGFSIVCPVFKPDFLRPLLESVLAQSWPHWELLLAVDGPPPAQRERILAILADYRDPRIGFRVQENQGTGPTRRALAQQARHDFVFPVDDDDLLPPDALTVFAGAILANPALRVLRGGTRLIGLVDAELPARARMRVDGIPSDPFEVNQL